MHKNLLDSARAADKDDAEPFACHIALLGVQLPMLGMWLIHRHKYQRVLVEHMR